MTRVKGNDTSLFICVSNATSLYDTCLYVTSLFLCIYLALWHVPPLSNKQWGDEAMQALRATATNSKRQIDEQTATTATTATSLSLADCESDGQVVRDSAAHSRKHTHTHTHIRTYIHHARTHAPAHTRRQRETHTHTRAHDSAVVCRMLSLCPLSMCTYLISFLCTYFSSPLCMWGARRPSVATRHLGYLHARCTFWAKCTDFKF